MNSQCLTTPPYTTTTKNPSLKKNYRLPKSLKPFYYDLKITTYFDILTEPNSFDGDVSIKFSCVESTSLISFHKAEMDITESSITVTSDLNPTSEFKVISTSYDEDTQIYKITLSQLLVSQQNYSINMKYVGKIQANNFGFYKSFYLDSNGIKRYL